MKTRISVKIDYELYDKYRNYVPKYQKSKVLESLLIKYLKEGLPECTKVKSDYSYLCSFTIELSVWKQFKEKVSAQSISRTMSSIIEKLLRHFMETRFG